MTIWDELSQELTDYIAGNADLLARMRAAMPDDDFAVFGFGFDKHTGDFACDDPAAKTIVLQKYTKYCPPPGFFDGG